MKSDRHDPNGDPQKTLPPRQANLPRRLVASEPGEDSTAGRGRRLRLGTPTNTTAPATDRNPAEIDDSARRGFKLGTGHAADAAIAATPKPGVQRWILFVAAGAMVLLVLALLLSVSFSGNSDAKAKERLLAQYTKYLEAKGQQSGIDVNERKKAVANRLNAIDWAKSVGDKATLQTELSELLFLDNDKNSPLYKYSMTELQRLGPLKKTTGL